MKGFVYSRDSFDNEDILKQVIKLRNKSLEELVSLYNREVKIGLVGVRAQVRFINALHVVFIEKFGYSPVTNTEELEMTIISLNQKIELIDDKWFFVTNLN